VEKPERLVACCFLKVWEGESVEDRHFNHDVGITDVMLGGASLSIYGDSAHLHRPLGPHHCSPNTFQHNLEEEE
jgi:hypothetical protein